MVEDETFETVTVNVEFCVWVVVSKADCEILESSGAVELPVALGVVVKVLAADTLVD